MIVCYDIGIRWSEMDLKGLRRPRIVRKFYYSHATVQRSAPVDGSIWFNQRQTSTPARAMHKIPDSTPRLQLDRVMNIKEGFSLRDADCLVLVVDTSENAAQYPCHANMCDLTVRAKLRARERDCDIDDSSRNLRVS